VARQEANQLLTSMLGPITDVVPGFSRIFSESVHDLEFVTEVETDSSYDNFLEREMR